MNTDEYKLAVEAAVRNGELKEAFRLLRVMAPANAWWLRNEVDRAEEDYGRIIDYAMTGAPDPSRESQIGALQSRIYTMLDLTVREAEAKDRPTLYYNTLRTERLRPADTITALLEATARSESALSAFSFGPKPKDARPQAEAAERRLWERVWVTVPLSSEDREALREALLSPTLPLRVPLLLVSALTLSGLEFYSEPTLLLLLDAATSGSMEMQVRASVGAALVMARWPRRSNTSAVARRLESLREQTSWSADMEAIFMQLIRTSDVEKISRQMRDEIIPEMMKLRPDLYKRIKPDADPSELEMNPEWEELLDKSGIADKLQKLSDLQNEGGDLFFSAFSMLKGYPFFSHPSAWFLPYDPEQSDAARALGHDQTLGTILAAAPTMCDGDKYSFTLSLDRLPQAHKDAMLQQLSDANINLAELVGTELLPQQKARLMAIAGYVQDLYRFFRLFRRKGEFRDPFAATANLAAVPLLKADFADPQKMRLIGEFYFKHEHWQEALDIFVSLQPDLALHQKMGHAWQRLGRMDRAAEQYERAEMLAPESAWTLRRLAAARRALGQPEEALKLYQRLERLEPERVATALAMGHCHLESGNVREALHSYYRAEFMDEKSLKPIRPIAWTTFLSRDFETSRKYYDRLMAEDTPTANDYLNMGHLSLATGHLREAINYYKLFSQDAAALGKALRGDERLLQQAGVDTSVIPLLLDSIRYKL